MMIMDLPQPAILENLFFLEMLLFIVTVAFDNP